MSRGYTEAKEERWAEDQFRWHEDEPEKEQPEPDDDDLKPRNRPYYDEPN